MWGFFCYKAWCIFEFVSFQINHNNENQNPAGPFTAPQWHQRSVGTWMLMLWQRVKFCVWLCGGSVRQWQQRMTCAEKYWAEWKWMNLGRCLEFTSTPMIFTLGLWYQLIQQLEHKFGFAGRIFNSGAHWTCASSSARGCIFSMGVTSFISECKY